MTVSQHALRQTPSDSYYCGQYASYWNAFLLLLLLKVPLMFQLTAQLHSQSLCHYTLSQLHNNAVVLTSSLHHQHYIRSCQTSLSILLRLMPNCSHLCARLSIDSQNKYFSLSQNCYFASLLRLRGNLHRTLLYTRRSCLNFGKFYFFIRHFHKHTKIAIMALIPTLYSYIFAVSFIIYILRC